MASFQFVAATHRPLVASGCNPVVRSSCTSVQRPHSEDMIDKNEVSKLVRDTAPVDDAYKQTLDDLGVIHELATVGNTFPSAADPTPSSASSFTEALQNYSDFFATASENPLRKTLGADQRIRRGLQQAETMRRRDAEPDTYLLRGKSQLAAAHREFEALINYAYHVDGQSLAAIAEATGKGRSTIADIVKKQTHVGPVLLARHGTDSSRRAGTPSEEL